jgi:hypothetical protein
MSSTDKRRVLLKVELELLRQKVDFCDRSLYNTLLSAYCHPCPKTITTNEGLLIPLNNHFSHGRLSARRFTVCRGLGSGHFNLDIPTVLEDNLGTSISRVVNLLFNMLPPGEPVNLLKPTGYMMHQQV